MNDNSNRLRQTNAFAMQYGLWLGAFFILTFGFYVAGMLMPSAMIIFIVLLLYTPFLATRLTTRFRRTVCGGLISFGRAYGFTLLQYIYATLLHALSVYIFFAFFENGMLVRMYEQAFADPNVMEQMKQMQMVSAQEPDAVITMLRSMTPIMYVSGFVTWNTFMSVILSLPTALWVRRTA